jgi:DNA-binding transcriptional ArsR family regulator
MDILERLVVDGPQTATELGAALDQSPSNCSWHLRKLAEHGFVEEVPGVAGRNRPWRAGNRGLTWNEATEDPETSAAGRALTDLMIDRELGRLRAARETEHRLPAEWRDVTDVFQSALWLTADEARELSARLRDLVLDHVERTFDPELRPAGARPVSLLAWLAVQPERSAPGSPSDPADPPSPRSTGDPS